MSLNSESEPMNAEESVLSSCQSAGFILDREEARGLLDKIGHDSDFVAKSLKQPSQDEACLRAYAEMFNGLNAGAPWPDLLKTKAGEWWSRHLDADSLRVVAAMTGRTGIIGGSKSAISKALVAVEQRLVQVSVINTWLREVGFADSREPAGASSRRPADGRKSRSRSKSADSHRRSASRSRSRSPRDARSRSPRRDKQGVVMLDAKSLQALFREAIAAGKESSGGNAAASEDKDERDAEVPVEKYLKKIAARVRRRGYTDPMALSRWFLDYVKDKNPMRGQQRMLSLGGGLKMAADEVFLKDVSQEYDERCFREGMDRLILMYLDDDQVAYRVPDMLRFSQKLWSMRIGTSLQRLKFAKDFMYKHAKKDDWASLIETDIILLRESFDERDDRRRGRSRSRSPKRAGSRHSGRGRSPPRGRGKSTSGRGGGQSKAKCYSRTDPKVGDCSYASCRFCHKCATCGKDHSAAKCPSWNPKMTKTKP